MPHSSSTTTTTTTTTTTETKMAPQVNGEAPSSAFLHHLTSLTHTSYSKISAPLAPYLHTPYSYLSPYLSKADSLGDSTLSSLDSKFPLVKKPTGELYDEGKAIVFYPLKKGNEGKEDGWMD
ncbi:uncharacterized protein LY89DRAFT_104605 [Mollisia scopiformis]|uniref:Uncharacterized protein n=1 Tax=Mollisia scopiformis TaxID=149040 RepID=A0A194X4Q0_MOLSC|nr:uncharacterized protein LY89DRAFT_104605 [Mollisia scopiformis]KUJ15151.1 hypothetical protein LY89DRAFT_104605 [Mollisia scopiformis]